MRIFAGNRIRKVSWHRYTQPLKFLVPGNYSEGTSILLPWTEESCYLTAADKESCARVLQERLHNDNPTFSVRRTASAWEVVIREELLDDPYLVPPPPLVMRCERALAPKLTVELLQFNSTESQLRCTIGIDQGARDAINVVVAIVVIPLFPLFALRGQYIATDALLGVWSAALMSCIFSGPYLYLRA